MVDVSGHLAMALLFAAPAWLLWGRRGSLTFAGFTLVTAMLPDTDLVLRRVFPTVHHHGVTHTILFITVASVVTGALAARLLTDHFEANRWVRSDTIREETVFVFATAGFLTGGMSHIFADLLSAPDIAPPLTPLWPLYAEPIIVDVIYYDSVVWNFGLLAVALAVHFALFRSERSPIETAYRIGDA
ncbi:metal-dependent hydrolase (plasmid) [Haladaptatus sp. SPP-AMP-3]|uniref:metal-dependent hydrolase n=1 Tax=Haladaptatus sp. SPP-AMP-3 TaxID=3121295 RepID=UPI003C2C07C1